MFTYQTPTWWVLVGDQKRESCEHGLTVYAVVRLRTATATEDQRCSMGTRC